MSLRESACLERYGSTFDGPEIAEQIDFSRLPLSSVVRPLWDARTLESLGFCEVEVDGDITGVLWDDKEKLLYGETPLFEIRAEKPGSPPRGGLS